MRIKFSAAILLLPALFSCDMIGSDANKEKPSEHPKEQVFSATIESPVAIDTSGIQIKIQWQESDAVGIFDIGKNEPVKAVVHSVDNDGTCAKLEPVSEISHPWAAFYPYGNIRLSNDAICVPVENVQSGDIKESNIAVAKADSSSFTFRSAVSFLHFTVADNRIKSVRISGNKLAGTIRINLDSTSADLVESTESDTISIQNIEIGKDYYVAIIPGKHENLRCSLYNEKGENVGDAFPETITLNSGEIISLGEFRQIHSDVYAVPFKDIYFKQYCINHFDTDKDGEISTGEAESITEIDIRFRNAGKASIEDDPAVILNIESLDGIERFRNLVGFTFDVVFFDDYGNRTVPKLKDIDLSKNSLLESLTVNNTEMTSIDLTQNTMLRRLSFDNNRLEMLDLSACAALEQISCNGNDLKELDVSGCQSLRELFCADNRITSLDISNNPELIHLGCAQKENEEGKATSITLYVSKEQDIKFVSKDGKELPEPPASIEIINEQAPDNPLENPEAGEKWEWN